MLPPHPTKNTRVALPRTAINFIASVLLLISSSSQHAFPDRAWRPHCRCEQGFLSMVEDWRVAEMNLTVQVADKMRLAAQTMASPRQPDRCAKLRATQAPMAMAIPSGQVRFGVFEVDLRSGELRKQSIKIKLHDQPFQILAMLLEHPGELVTREQLHQRLWPSDTFVDFDVGLNSAIKRLRDALGDSAEEPRYIETLPRRGYRFIARIENGALPTLAIVEEHRAPVLPVEPTPADRKSTRLNSSHLVISYAVFCLKKKKNIT